jgi:hypothetical protein
MCFVLYIASPKPLPLVGWDETTGDIHTEPISDRDLPVKAHFKNPHIYYVGSDTHCGCGFRNASYQNGCWPEEEWQPEGDTSQIAAQPNHERLVQFIHRYLSEPTTFEFYGMWEGDFTDPSLSDQTIPLDRLLDLSFYFRDRGHYTVTKGKSEQAAS